MSQIYGHLYEELEPKRYVRGSTLPALKIEAGLALEEMLELGFKKRQGFERPGEFTTPEGIIFSPDLLCFEDVTRLGEIKLTWMTNSEVPREPANSFPAKFDKWLVQIKAYCYYVDTPYARLYAYFVNGNGRRPQGPELLAWDLEFSSRELKENQTMLLNHARHMGVL